MDQAVQTLIQKRKGSDDKEKILEARNSFANFVTYANPRFQMFPHCEIVINALDKVATGKIKRLIIEEPPRHGKSELVSRLFPAYYLSKYPSRWAGLCSYSYSLAESLSRLARENYLKLGVECKGDAARVQHWETLAGGGMWAAGVGGSITGKGGDILCVDDSCKDAETAASQVMREKTWEWYSSTFSTRAEPDAAIVICQTRWHEDDLVGRLLEAERYNKEKENWTIISFPALYDEKHAERFPASCTVVPDFRKLNDEPLCPERYSEKKLKHKRVQMGAYRFSSLYQQQPTTPTGVLFDITKLEVVEAVPGNVRKRIRGWDKAATANAGDWTAGVRIAKGEDGRFYIEDVQRGQWDSSTRDTHITFIAKSVDGPQVSIITEQEPGSSGKDVAQTFVRMLTGFHVSTKPSTGSKATRADPFSSQVNAGNVRLVKGAWNDAYIEELRQFPNGRHDDQVDGTSVAFNELNAHQAWKVSTFRF